MSAVWGPASQMTEDPVILPPVPPAPSASGVPGSETAQALLARLARHGTIPDDVLALVDGPLAAADYAAKAITPQTVATYQADWSDFATWARQHGVDPTILPIHPVVIAAWLATLAPKSSFTFVNMQLIRCVGSRNTKFFKIRQSLEA